MNSATFVINKYITLRGRTDFESTAFGVGTNSSASLFYLSKKYVLKTEIVTTKAVANVCFLNINLKGQ